MGLAQGQVELKALLLKKEKKKKKRTVLFNSGRRFGNTLQNEEDGSSIGKSSPQGGKPAMHMMYEMCMQCIQGFESSNLL